MKRNETRSGKGIQRCTCGCPLHNHGSSQDKVLRACRSCATCPKFVKAAR